MSVELKQGKNYLVRGMAHRQQVRVYACQVTGIVEELRQRHDTWPLATIALGQTLAVTAMMGAMLKSKKDTLSVRVKGSGPIGKIVCDCNVNLGIRGTLDHPHVDLPLTDDKKWDISGAIGLPGTISVMRDLGMREPYQGSIPLETGELALDFTRYFADSEQTPSSLGLGVCLNKDGSVRAAGGFLIQMMPFAEEEVINAVEKSLSQAAPVSEWVDQYSPLELLGKVLDTEIEFFEEKSITRVCYCSRNKIEKVLLSLGKDTLKEIIDEGKSEEVVCHFCNEPHVFSTAELTKLLEQLG